MNRIPCYDKEGNTIKSLIQWDKNQSVYIDDLENGSLPRVHFALGSNAKESKEYKDNVEFDGKKIKITIPNELLKTYAEMYLFLYYGDVESEEPLTTKYMVKIPITKKPQPDDYIYEDNVDYLSIYKLKLELSLILDNATNYAAESRANKESAETAAREAAGSAQEARNILSDVNAAGANQIQAIETAGAEQTDAAKAEIDAKGKQTLDSIPEDYTGLQTEVDDLKGDLTNAENALTLVKSRNYFDKSKSEIISVQGTSVLASPKVSVNAGDKYYLSHHRNDSSGLLAEPFWGILGYDSSDSETLLGNWLQGYSIPSGIVSVRFLEASTNYTYIMVEKDTQTKVWEDFFEPYYKCVDDEARENISAISESIEDKTEFVVPSAFYGVVGHETNIYYQNIAKNMSIDSVCGFDTTGLSNVERYRDRLIWKPTSSGTNNGKISFYKNDWNHETKNITVSFKSAPANTGNTEIKVIVIGDSKIAYGEVVRYLDSLFADDNHTLILLGSRYDNQDTGDAKYKHEGRSGWSSYHYAYVNSYNGSTNAFYNENYTDSQYGTKFDFTTYMNNQGYTSVDYVFINLGTNDYGQGMSDIKWQTDAMIKSIRAFDANIKIVIGLNEGVYRNDLQHKALNEWIYDLNATKISKYDGKASKVYVLPLYPSIDLVNDYSTTSADMSEGDSVVGNNKKRNKVSDPIHQNRAGFYKYAMCIYSLIKCIEGGLIN